MVLLAAPPPKNESEKEKPKWKFSKINIKNKGSSILYFGSSVTGVKSRLLNLLTNRNPKIYALHLEEWFRGKYKLAIYAFDDIGSNDLIQILEEKLSKQLNPAFGKKVGSNILKLS